MKNNQFIYETATGKRKGFFNVYQAKNGCIYLQMGNKQVGLSRIQALELAGSSLYDLKDFDNELFHNFYKS